MKLNQIAELTKTDGDCVKVNLGSEWPWAQFVESSGDDSFIGKVTNNLVCTDEHGFSKDDKVKFRLIYDHKNKFQYFKGVEII